MREPGPKATAVPSPSPEGSATTWGGPASSQTVRRLSAEEAARGRVPVDVAVGVLMQRDAQGRDDAFLLTTRPDGKVWAGYWEFPGGKFEPGETVEQALARELHEELGIQVGQVTRWREQLMDYPHARVRLHFCKVYDWAGDFEMREGQAMSWERLPVACVPVLPGTVPVLEWLAEERGFTGVTHTATAAAP